MEPKHIDMFRKLLQDQLAEQLLRKDEPIVCEKLPDPIDAAIEDNEKTLATKFISRKKYFIFKLNKALQKIEAGTYGECERCGDDINPKRLMARPTASLCIECKQEEETSERKEKERLSGGINDSWDD